MSEELAILDVAHGNTAVLVSAGQAAVFDAAPGATLPEALEFYQLTVVDYVFISHADFDHMGGVLNLLADRSIQIRHLFVNTDASKNTKAWEALAIAVNDAHARYGLVVTGLNSSLGSIPIGRAQVRVLYPSPGDALLGAGTRLTSGRRVTSNAASVVLLLSHHDHPVALFAGDMEQPTLTSLMTQQTDLRADLLVFPHHGGLVRGNLHAFAFTLTQQVQPKVVVFSIGRRGHANPRPAVVAAVKQAMPHVAILCTQLSQNCYSQAPPVSLDWVSHLSDVPGLGVETNSSCSGSIRVELNGSNSVFHLLAAHRQFVLRNVPGGLCV